MTLGQALQMARARSPLVPVAGARRQIAEGRARGDGAIPNPTFEWRRENLNSALQPDIFGTVQVPIDFTGRRLALRAAVAEGTARGRADSMTTLRGLEVDVARAYWRASLAVELLAVARDERRARGETAEFDAGRFREGAVAEVAAMRTRLETDRARMSEATAVVDAERARGELARAIGMHVDSLPQLARIAPLGEVDAAPVLGEAMVRATLQRADLVALRHAAAEAERRAAAERRGVVSDLQIVSGYKTTSGINTGVVGVLVPLPIFNRNDGARMRSRGEHVIAVAELRDAEVRVQAEVTAAVRGYAAMRDALAAGVVGIERRAAQVASIAEGAYREGAISLMELVEAQRARTEARAAAMRWTVDLRLAHIELNRATGAPIAAAVAEPKMEKR